MKKWFVGIMLLLFSCIVQTQSVEANTTKEISNELEWYALAEVQEEYYQSYKLVADIEVNSTITLSSPIRLDLNGHSVTGRRTVIVNNSALDITDV